MPEEPLTAKPPPPNSSFELASRNTSLSLQRTRMAADRTLMAVIRTSLSLISFGFTIFKLAQGLIEENLLRPSEAAVPHYGITLVLIGIIMLAIGIIYHVQFMIGLRISRKELIADALIHRENPFPISFTVITALVLLVLGIVVITSMIFRVGPFE